MLHKTLYEPVHISYPYHAKPFLLMPFLFYLVLFEELLMHLHGSILKWI